MNKLEDFKVNPRFKLSALWISVMFCYVYGDFFSLFVPGHIESLMQGNSGVGKTTPITLLLFAMMMTVPSIMIFLCLILKPEINRWANIITGTFFTAIMILVVATSIGEWTLFYIYLGTVEIGLTMLIVWQALNWPREKRA